ncbi:peptidase family M48-domain-containing protein [Chytridium lagenaria]|nr:peptidase family M48-domain-containing protein [Chytridium lagenaria]
MLWKWNFFKRYPRIMWTIATLPVVGTVFVIAYSYEVHPLTHRGRLMFVDEATELEVANENYATLLKEFGPKLLPVEHPDYQLTAKIALDIISVVGPELRDWDLHVVDDDSVVNAFVIASGKIFVFTGIIRMCRSPDALAAIMAHEVSHVLSRHIGEKMGIAHVFQLFTDLFHSILYTYTLNLPMIADITGRTVDVISPYFTDQPYSRMCESEADLIGLFMMSLAGYNPREAVKFWQVLADAERENEDAVPEFMSDHPSHERRAEELSEHMEMALEIYNARARLVDALSEAVRSGKGEEDPRVKRLERDMWSKFETAMAVNPA